MFGSQLLDVAVGMVFVYLLLSLICSAVNELIETRLRNRASDLESGIKELLGTNTGLVDKLYAHGLIFSLYRGTYAEASKNNTLPSYIPSQNFAAAVASILGPGGANIPTAADVRNSINIIANEQVKSALLTILNNAQNDLDKFRTGLEAWFNSTMDRVSGWYKRRTHIIIFVLGFVIAVALNVDSISIAQKLWTNQATRDALVGAAQGYLEKHKPAQPADSSSTTPKPATTDTQDASNLDLGLRGDIAELQKTNLPIGWHNDTLNQFCKYPYLWLVALVGWLLTACAASLGAPFWFDLLSKIVVVRSSIRPGEKSPPATPKAGAN